MADEGAKPEPTDSRTLRIIFWRRIEGVGGLLLAAAFFLPAVKSCNTNIVPAEEVWGAVRGSSASLSEWAGVFVWFVAAYLFGLLTAIVALRGYHLRREPGAVQGVSIVLLLVLVAGVILATAAIAVVDDLLATATIDWGWPTAIITCLALLSVAYGLRGWRLGPAGLLGIRWYMAVLCVLWFGYWAVAEFVDTLVGLWLSLAGAAVIAVGAHREAMACTGWPTRRTLWALLTCRLRAVDVEGPRCTSCDYLLIGLTVPRCPECGRPFAWKGAAARGDGAPAVGAEQVESQA